jgi:NitT/TauT family transport system permease protein
MTARGQIYILQVLIGIVFLALWEFGSKIPGLAKFSLFDPFVVSSPMQVLQALQRLFLKENFSRHVLLTLGSTGLALLVGIFLGFIFAFISYNLSFFRRFTEPFFQFFNTMPRVVIAPFLLMTFGTGFQPRVLMAVSFIFFLVYYNVLYGLTRIEPSHLRQVKVLGGNRMDEVMTLQIPIGFAWTVRAFPHAVAYGFVGTVFQEFVGGDSGIGSVMIYGLNALNSATVMATVVTLAALGWMMFWVGNRVGEAFAPWRGELGV